MKPGATTMNFQFPFYLSSRNKSGNFDTGLLLGVKMLFHLDAADGDRLICPRPIVFRPGLNPTCSSAKCSSASFFSQFVRTLNIVCNCLARTA